MNQTRMVIRLLDRSDPRGPGERWGGLVLPASVDRNLVCRVGGFPRNEKLGSLVLSRPWNDLPAGTTLVRGSTSSGDTAVVAIFEAA